VGWWREGQTALLEVGLGTIWIYALPETSRTLLDYDMVGKPTPAPRAACDGFHVGVVALLVVEVDHQAERSDTANLTPDSMREHTEHDVNIPAG
jgi:hypothetical protein